MLACLSRMPSKAWNCNVKFERAEEYGSGSKGSMLATGFALSNMVGLSSRGEPSRCGAPCKGKLTPTGPRATPREQSSLLILLVWDSSSRTALAVCAVWRKKRDAS